MDQVKNPSVSLFSNIPPTIQENLAEVFKSQQKL
jgi:hypothetical protein